MEGNIIMTIGEAWKIVGNQPKFAINNMVKALSMLPALNTPEENRRLEAGKICLKTANPKYATNKYNTHKV